MIYDLGERLTTLQDQADLFENAMSICFETLQFERGAIGGRRRGQRTVDWPVVRNLRGREGELTISRSLLSRALEHGERAMFADDGAKADPTVSMVQHGIRSAMCVPLLLGDEILGVIYGDRTSTSTVYSPEDIDFFAAIARQLSIGLVNARLMEDQRQMALLSHDLDVARNIQTSLFPSDLPKRDGLAVAALNDPGRRVSGDYYDVIERDDGRIWFLIADVTGEGVSAAMLMANLQAAVRVTISETDDPGQLLTKWNKLVCLNAASARFITCLLALVDPATKKMRVGNAGHWPPIQIREGSAPMALEIDGGYPLGVDEGAVFTAIEVDLGAAPSMLLSFTDGVIEAINTAGETYNHDRLLTMLARKSYSDPQALIKAVRKDVSEFAGEAQQSDDITMVGLRIGDASAAQ
jgi:sigma-B regulation protein RsbU (phosphoserine phosphatase)